VIFLFLFILRLCFEIENLFGVQFAEFDECIHFHIRNISTKFFDQFNYL